MQKISRQIKQNKILVISLAIFMIFSGAVRVLAVAGGPFYAGETLDPDCAPGGTCIVDIGRVTSLATGFTLAGGTISKTLTVDEDATLSAKANLASPTFSGTPLAPTAAYGTDTTQLATTAFVQDAAWLLTGNASTVDGTNFIGTTNNVPLTFKVNNEKAGRIDNTLANSFYGYLAGNANTFAKQNVAIGDGALYTQSYANGDSAWATDNTATGFHALYLNEPTASNNGRRNVAVGSLTLTANTIGQSNIAIGFQALTANTTAGQNVAIGVGALQTQSYDNGGSVYNSDNVAIGFQALNKNQPTSSTEGIQNIALGTQALYSNTTGSANTASGYQSLYSNTTGAKNTAFGMNALYTNSTGTGNVALGYMAGKYETGSDAFYVDNKDRSDTAGDKAGAILYGTFNTTPASQTLQVNASIGILTTPTARLHLPGGTATASTAPLKFISGTNLTSPEAGAMEWDGTNLYITQTSGPTRKTLVYTTDLSLYAPLASPIFTGIVTLPVGLTGVIRADTGVVSVDADVTDLVDNLAYSALADGTDGNLITWDATGAPALVATGSSGQVLTSNGAGTAPTFQAVASSGWGLTGNASTIDGTNFIGTTDNIPFNIKVNNEKAGRIDNTLSNAFFGYQVGNNNSFGYKNVAVGHEAFFTNTFGYLNNAFGYGALYANTEGIGNVAVGQRALYANTTANYNVAVGSEALFYNITGYLNVAMGGNGLWHNTTGYQNTSVGINALFTNTTGYYNTAIGYAADVGSNNLTNATAIGYNAIVGASNSLVLGGTGVDSVKVGIGLTIPVHTLDVVGTAGLSTGTAWTNTSDRRFKTIENELTGSSLEKVLNLRPIAFRWNELHNQKFNSTSDKLNFGFVAQEVETIFPSFVTTDDKGYKWYNPSGFEAVLTASIQELDLKITEINNLEKENDWRDSLVAWFNNAANRITRIFTGEVCITEAGEEPVCLNRAELKALKDLINVSTPNFSFSLTPSSELTVESDPVDEPEIIPEEIIETESELKIIPEEIIELEPEVVSEEVIEPVSESSPVEEIVPEPELEPEPAPEPPRE